MKEGLACILQCNTIWTSHPHLHPAPQPVTPPPPPLTHTHLVTMNMWNPSHAQFTVLRARNLIAKGKAGNNDVFVTIQLGKEKYQTSTIKNAHNPEWFEECDLPIPHLHSEIEVSVYHRGVLSDDFLGYASIPLWEQKIQDTSKTQWIQLRNKPSRGPDSKYRGEIEVKVTFHCHSRVDFTSGLKKRSSSIRSLATAVGDKLKLSRSRSFRENRKDPEGGKTERNQSHNSSLQDGPEEGLTRSYSLSAAYIKTMSVDRGNVLRLAASSQEGDDGRSQSLYNIPGNRHSMVEFPSSQPPPPYQVRPSVQDDLTLVRASAHLAHTLPRPPPVSTTPSYVDSVLHRREHARYESIRERTEPESSSSDNEGPQRRPLPPPRGGRPRPRPLSADMNIDPKDLKALATLTPPRQGTGSRESTPVTVGDSRGQFTELHRSEMITNGSLQFDRGGLSSSLRKKSGSSGQIGVNGDVKMRKRVRREQLKMYRQAGRRFTVQDLESRLPGFYDDSPSDPSDSSRTEIPEDVFSAYKNMTKEELLRMVIQNKAQLIRKDQYIRDLESYIDNLLVRVMETQPRILNRPPMSHR
ncbi:rab11 family-interacting protein 2-like isoform X2 [Babylonia areolata]|uniref:rab11 family-interacting protein 2-like isoform X2 n=1 Tax=Babylonia areolata TaxID=304850 RepID=UPI003FCFD7F6